MRSRRWLKRDVTLRVRLGSRATSAGAEPAGSATLPCFGDLPPTSHGLPECSAFR
ncbi:MAG: hypothetical protein U0V87_01770 [Acidobacteriota bacterium]